MTHTPEFLSHFPKAYGVWAGNRAGIRPDYSRCCATVHQGFHSYQCAKKNGHGPDGAYCSTHNPAAVQARRDKAEQKYRADMDARLNMWKRAAGASKLIQAMKAIAEGHNDPRSLATEILAELGLDD